MERSTDNTSTFCADPSASRYQQRDPFSIGGPEMRVKRMPCCGHRRMHEQCLQVRVELLPPCVHHWMHVACWRKSSSHSAARMSTCGGCQRAGMRALKTRLATHTDVWRGPRSGYSAQLKVKGIGSGV
jgi:hypothetical protein